MDLMTIQCRSCPVRGTHCDDCMVTALLQLPQARGEPGPHDLPLDAEDRACVDRFVASGLLSAAGAWRVRAVAEHRAWGRATG